MIERHLIRYFLAVVDGGTFSKAADLCRVSQPTMSSGIARLEAVVGQSLFNRSNRRVELTAAGARLVTHARRIEAEFLEAQRALSDVTPSTLVRLGVASTVSTGMVEAAIGACSEERRFQIEIVERRPSEMNALLDRGRVDLVIGPIEAGSKRALVKLFDEPYHLVMTDKHPLTRHEAVSCEQIVDEPMLVRRQCEALPMVSQFFTARGVRPFMAARSISEERVAAYVRAGLGITVMPTSLAGSGIVSRPLIGLDLTRTIGLIVEPGEHGRLAKSGLVDRIGKAILDTHAQRPLLGATLAGVMTHR